MRQSLCKKGQCYTVNAGNKRLGDMVVIEPDELKSTLCNLNKYVSRSNIVFVRVYSRILIGIEGNCTERSILKWVCIPLSIDDSGARICIEWNMCTKPEGCY